MRIYLDESGDLGWKLDLPYGQGGSSRYLTLAIMFVPHHLRKLPKKLIVGLYSKYGWQNEKKASGADLAQKEVFSELAVQLIRNNPTIKVDVITVRKDKVASHIRSDANKLYNFMVACVVPEYVGGYATVLFMPDERSVKVKSGNSLVDHLQTKLWFELNLKTKIINQPAQSHMDYNIQFVDWIAHCVWSKFENVVDAPYDK